MKIIHLTDIHGNYSDINNIPELPTSDLIILSGDITHFGHRNDIEKIITSIDHPNILCVPGNCDHDDVEDYLITSNTIINSKGLTFNKYSFIGLGGSLPCPGKTPNEHEDNYYASKLEESTLKNIDGNNCILVTHQPPYKTKADRIFYGIHVGSRSIRKFIETKQPLLCLTGHIHEGKGIDSIGKTQIVNPGPFRNNNYAIIDIADDKPISIDMKNLHQ